jgi:Bacterial Ig-like domain (group 3)
MILNGKMVLVCLVLVMLLATTAQPAASQTWPSQLEVNGSPATGFVFPDQLPLFSSLAAYSNGILVNVSGSHFVSAEANFANYSKVVDEFELLHLTNPKDVMVIDSINASKADFNTLINQSQRYGALNASEASLVTTDSHGNESTQNVLEMRRLASDIRLTEETIAAENADIYALPIQNGLDLSPYSGSANNTGAYLTQIDSQVRNLTSLVFSGTNTTLTGNPHTLRYGDTLVLQGSVQTGTTGLANSSVSLRVDNKTVATPLTDRNGSFSYDCAVNTTPAGPHAIIAFYTAGDVPYQSSSSDPLNFTVTDTPAVDQISASSGSLIWGGSVTVKGGVLAAGAPVSNASVALYVNNNKRGDVSTDGAGNYSVTYKMNPVEYLASFFGSKASAYTQFEPTDQPLTQARSGAIAMPVVGSDIVSFGGSFFVLVAAIVVVAFLGIYVIRFRAKPDRRVPAEASAADVTQLPVAVEPGSQVEEAQSLETDSARSTIDKTREHVAGRQLLGSLTITPDMERAQRLFGSATRNDAIKLLYADTQALLVARSNVTLTPAMSHWEKYSLLERAVPRVRTLLHSLTYLYELARYSGKTMTTDQLLVAIRDFEALRDLLNVPGETP